MTLVLLGALQTLSLTAAHAQWQAGVQPSANDSPHTVIAAPDAKQALDETLAKLDADLEAARAAIQRMGDRRGIVSYETKFGDWSSPEAVEAASKRGVDTPRRRSWSGAFVESPSRALAATNADNLMNEHPPRPVGPWTKVATLIDGPFAYVQFHGEKDGQAFGTPDAPINTGTSGAVHGIGGPATGLAVTLDWIRCNAAGLSRGMASPGGKIQPVSSSISTTPSQRIYTFDYQMLDAEGAVDVTISQVITLDPGASFFPVSIQEVEVDSRELITRESVVLFEYSDATTADGQPSKLLQRATHTVEVPRYEKGPDGSPERVGFFTRQAQFTEAVYSQIEAVPTVAESEFKLDRQSLQLVRQVREERGAEEAKLGRSPLSFLSR